MKTILTSSILIIIILSVSCARKSTPPPSQPVVECDTTVGSHYTYKCIDTSSYIKQGFCEEYLGDLKTAEGAFKNDKPDGIWKYWFKNDLVRMEGTYREGVKHGKWNYYENDRLFYTFIYSEDTISDSIRAEDPAPKENEYGPVESSERMPVMNIDILPFLRKKICNLRWSMDYGIQGTVWVEYTTNEAGEVHNVKVVKSPPNAAELERESLRAMRQLPRFRPGLKNNKPVSVRYTIPIQFKIK